jgi:hypothetical protein
MKGLLKSLSKVLRPFVKRLDPRTRLFTSETDFNQAVDRILQFESLPLPHESEWYGIGNVVRELAKLPPRFPLHLQIHHAAYIEETPLHHYDVSPLPVLVCRSAFVRLHARSTQKTAMVLGSPQIRYRRIRRIDTADFGQGTLAFPCHSSHHVAATFDDKAYADELLNLPVEFHPLTVCMYWKDILEGRHLFYSRKGIRVVTAGHIADPCFLEIIYGYLRQFKYTTGNFTGTHSIMSLEMGIPYFNSGPTPIWEDRTGGDVDFLESVGGAGNSLRMDQLPRPIGSLIDKLLPKPGKNMEISDELKKHVSYLHDCDAPLDADELRKFAIRAYIRFDPAAANLRELSAISRKTLAEILNEN